MNLALSITAILISIASFAFGLLQYRNKQKLDLLRKSNELLKKVYSLRKSAQDLRNKIDVTDDIDSHEDEIELINSLCENIFGKFLKQENITLEEVHKLETNLIQLDLRFSLLVKLVNVEIAFNEELIAAG